MNHLQRFLDAQQNSYDIALSEIKNGIKQSHWMWYIFPQIAGLGFSSTSRFYAIKDLEEAKEYFEHPVLGKRLIEICTRLLEINGRTANQVFGKPDDLKLRSSMTLFGLLQNTNPVFQAVIDKYFNGEKDLKTMALIENAWK
jgi:uncharacterized protein (DUF1810 family)